MLKTGFALSTKLRGDFNSELEMLKSCGVDCVDTQIFVDTDTELFKFSDADFEKSVIEYKNKIQGAGLEIYQSHGPWRFPPMDSTPEERDERFAVMEKSLYGCRLLESPRMVIHPLMPFGMDDTGKEQEMWDINIDFYSRLCKVAEREKVIICFENMPMPKLSLASSADTLRFVKAIDSPYFKVCLDTGHSEICGVPAGEAVSIIGKEYLETLHIHDNDGRMDWHWLPYMGVTDWEKFRNALKSIDFEGCVSLETDIRNGDKMPEEIFEHQRKSLAMIAQHLAK